MDIYCAICGSCFGGVKVKKRLPREQRQTETGTSALGEAAVEKDGGNEDNGSEDEDYGYDGNVIEEKDLEWLKRLRVLGFNSDVADLNKCVAALARFFCDAGLMIFIGHLSLGLEATRAM
jgi:hypothetical protein